MLKVGGACYFIYRVLQIFCLMLVEMGVHALSWCMAPPRASGFVSDYDHY